MSSRFYPFINAAQNTSTINGLTHNFYRYPARFPPHFVDEAIRLFSDPGDLILDPFVGGGTTLVEASCLGRRSIGIDISSLAVFVSRVKTTTLSRKDIKTISEWVSNINGITINTRNYKSNFWFENGYQRNLDDSRTWRLRNLIEGILFEIDKLSVHKVKDFLRCAVLKTGQWALDNKSAIPSVGDFRQRFCYDVLEMIEGITEYSKIIHANKRPKDSTISVINRSAIGIEEEDILQQEPPKLILMSPPYPGVHVLYHRWQIKGRKETPAPFWIADKLDGKGQAFYTFGDRKSHHKKYYFQEMQEVFHSLSKISNRDTTLIQMVAFSKPDQQLPRYLRLLEKSGFEEVFLTKNKTRKRIWRKVPNRKWYADLQGNTASSREVVLIHKKI